MAENSLLGTVPLKIISVDKTTPCCVQVGRNPPSTFAGTQAHRMLAEQKLSSRFLNLIGAQHHGDRCIPANRRN
jgi:hypothetical protein